jgi:hypothetical protein
MVICDYIIRKDGILECPICVAELISPAIRQLRKTDPSITAFTFPSPINLTHLSHIISVTEGHPVPLPFTDLSSYLAISETLGSTSLLFDSSVLDQPISPENIIQAFFIRDVLQLPNEAEISYVATHLHRISLDYLNALPLSIISAILSHPDVIISSEDSLFSSRACFF